MSRREVEGKEAARKAAVLEGTVVVVTVGLAGPDCADKNDSPGLISPESELFNNFFPVN